MIMKQKVLFISALAMIMVSSCGPSQKVTSSWKNPQVTAAPKYNKIFIAALVANPRYKSVIENDLANAARARGLQVVSSADIFPNTYTSNSNVSKDDVLAKVRATGSDAIMTVSLVDKASETRYVPGSTTYMPHMGYGGFGGYYGYAYGSMYSTPGYYTEDKTYFMEARLFDASNESLVWSAQSEAYNPSKIEKFSKDYTATLVERMKRDWSIK
jgi:hypothetical protein